MNFFKKSFIIFGFVFSVFVFTGCFQASGEFTTQKTVYQISTINALLEGYYGGFMTFGEMREYGDFGLGTFNALDGELIAFDGNFYQIKADGRVYEVTDDMTSSFVTLAFFEADEVFYLNDASSFAALEKNLDEKLPSDNIFYAFKISGEFDYIKTRSVPAQEKPYPRLIDIARFQPEFEFKNINGTIAGFKLPAYIKDINVPGYHLHFLADDLSGGGHLLECGMKNVKVEIAHLHSFYMVLPETKEFYGVNTSPASLDEVHKIEK